MNSKKARKLPQLSAFPVEQVTPAVLILLEICHEQAEDHNIGHAIPSARLFQH